jgi:transaldolase
MAVNEYLGWMTKNTKSVYWNDSAIHQEIDYTIEWGAVGATTNPFLVNTSLRAEPKLWEPVLKPVPKGLQGDEKAQALLSSVTREVAAKFARFSDKNNVRLGGVCAQVNPHNCADIEAMIAQAKHYAGLAPNICVKFPANRAGLFAYEECAALGMNVVATVSFTVSQAVAAAEAFKRGAERARKAGKTPGLGVAVIMGGRLYEYLKDIIKDRGLNISEKEALYSGTAVLKRAYEIFIERGYEAKLMPASGRVTSPITDLAGADLIMSITPKIAAQLAELKEPFVEGIGNPINKEALDKLMQVDEFVKAFELDGLSPDAMITYGPFNRTLMQFIFSGWDQLYTVDY